MIPLLDKINSTQQRYLNFIERLKYQGFEGDLSPDYANRVVLSTDNSIYQVLPQGVVYPKHVADLKMIAELAVNHEFKDVVLSARGGGTGTNGQSLTDGLVVDISKHMNQILEINVEERWVRVQTGVVKDQLNAALKSYGLFFAPELSTSNRATIGGMINTDASGQGSVLYGKTRDHVLELSSIWLGGIEWQSGPISDDQLAEIVERNDHIGSIHRLLNRINEQYGDEVQACFPKLNRCLTGYDLAHIRDESGRFNLNSVLCGAEGSLAFITEAKLNVLPIPKVSALVNIKYDSFEASLRDANDLMEWGPTSIETVDSNVLNLAMQDIVWDSVASYFPANESEPNIQGINLLEYTGDDEDELQFKVDKLCAHLDQMSGQPGKSFGYTVAMGEAEIGKIWGMRKRAVGLLGNAQGSKRPIPFVEDTAVPPENLADFIMEFRAALDSRGLSYGMFGHVDAGVLHVRPAIDMKDPEQERLIREVTDEVVALTQKYKGLLWGEHGKGFRSEYAPEFFGSLYPVLQQIKAAFDPRNQLNPGKIATPAINGAELLKIDQVTTRGQHDRQIPLVTREAYDTAMSCNGNGACYNYDPNDAMCPSWKSTRERVHSPKGRASLVREWLRLLAERGVEADGYAKAMRTSSGLLSLTHRVINTFKKRQGQYDFSHEVHEAMAGCLACKSCVGQCPIKVNVPDFRARFLELYYTRYLRPAKDYMVATLEDMLPWLAKFPAPYNWAMSNSFMKRMTARWIGMVDSPTICKLGLNQGMQQRGILLASDESLAALSTDERSRTVVIVQDAFTSYFETELVLDMAEFMKCLGFTVMIAPFAANGKPLHVHGFMKRFAKIANANVAMLRRFEAQSVALVGVDPSMTLTYRQEYKQVVEGELPEVKLVQEWLAANLDLIKCKQVKSEKRFRLMAHCTEKTNAAASINDWRSLFDALGVKLDVIATGCCGMAGTFGHEADNQERSKTIYEQSWQPIIQSCEENTELMATGYSCRSQVKRFDGVKLKHPVQVLLALVK